VGLGMKGGGKKRARGPKKKKSKKHKNKKKKPKQKTLPTFYGEGGTSSQAVGKNTRKGPEKGVWDNLKGSFKECCNQVSRKGKERHGFFKEKQQFWRKP